jgi:hypothetical protein
MSDWKMVMEQTTMQVKKTDLAPKVSVYSDVIMGHEQLIPYIEQVTGTGMILWEKAELSGNSVDTMLFDYPQQLKDPNDQSILFDERMSLVLGGFLGFPEVDYVQENESSRSFVHDKFLLMKYGEGAEFPISGKDDGGYLNVMYYLNDDYEGGAIEFPNLGITYQPRANEVLIFPASKGFEYTVAKMTSGTKYSVVTYLR